MALPVKQMAALPGDRFRRDEFPLVILRQRPQGPVGLHSHRFTELVVILGGRGRHFSGADEYEIMAGDCFVVSGAHGYKDTDNLALVNILFFPDRLGLPLAEARKLPGYHAFFALEPQYRRRHKFRSCLRLSLDELTRVSGLIDQMESELQQRMPGFEFVAVALLMELIGRLARAYAHMDQRASRSLIRLGEVLSYLERHCAETIHLEDLAAIAHMSSSNLLRAFRLATGHAPIDYLIRLRIHRACDRLRRGDLNVTEAALQAGFNDSNYFARQFRQVMGCAPREYLRYNQTLTAPESDFHPQ